MYVVTAIVKDDFKQVERLVKRQANQVTEKGKTTEIEWHFQNESDAKKCHSFLIDADFPLSVSMKEAN